MIMMHFMTTNSRSILLPEAPIFSLGITHFDALTSDGEMLSGGVSDAQKFITNTDFAMLCHMPSVARRLRLKPFQSFDLLELFAFVKPATFTLPTPAGLMVACGFPVPKAVEDYPMALRNVALFLLEELVESRQPENLKRLVWAMSRGGWPWAPAVIAALGEGADDGVRAAMSGLDVWRKIPEWQDDAPLAPAGSHPIAPPETRRRLADLLGQGSEERPSQADFASAVSTAFTNPVAEGAPNFILAEAGTGVGKTLGYIAPASLWAEKNEAPVWLSTYTRNLQHQIDDELNRLYPDPTIKAQKVVIRKGRENYLCLLNFEDAARAVATNPRDAIALGLMARWVEFTRDGDLSGGDFPSWLSDLVGPRRTVGLSDRRGECIYTACSHYSRCFIETGIKRSRRADLIIANHALVMVQATSGALDPGGRSNRFVFDEGHHVFDAADSAFSACLSGLEGWELRRWLRGVDTRNKSRAKGLKNRCEDLLGGSDGAQKALEALLHAALILPGEGWHQRIAEGRPDGPTEAFLLEASKLVYARANGRDGPYSLETQAIDTPDLLLVLAKDLKSALEGLLRPAKDLKKALLHRLDEEAESLDSATRARIDLICRSLTHRCEHNLVAWQHMLTCLTDVTPDSFVDWFAIDRIDGRDVDIGLHRHWVDPTIPFVEEVVKPSHGMVITSATLTDGSGDMETDWATAETRTGAPYLESPAIRAKVPSPFDYPTQTRVFVVTDVRKDDLQLVAAAYRELMLASGGGALGLFTAISRLRAVQGAIAEPLENAGLSLYSQHVDGLNLPTLIDIFRAEINSCLLGTDAVRDGVDVPGESLRMIVFDRVPWPRPTILHKSRRATFGKKHYDDMLTRLKLKQAFGRLVRRGDDKGVFVMLDPMMPSRLAGAFPEGVDVQRVGLADAIIEIKSFFGTNA